MSRAKTDARIVVIGGGTGSFVVLSGLKRYARNITALVSMADDGGSTGQLRDELGVLPPGDVRQCLVALSDSPRLRDLFTYRFEEGSFKGHAFGNVFLTALEKMTGNFAEAVEEASRVLAITGRVEPITLDEVTMRLATSDGRVIDGQFSSEQSDFLGALRPNVSVTAAARVNPRADQAIREANLVVIAPGALYTSIAPALVVDGVSEALTQTRATKVYICNLVTKPGHTDGFAVHDYAEEIERFAGVPLDVVLYNNSEPSAELLEKYAHDRELPVRFNLDQLERAAYDARGRSLLSGQIWGGGAASDPLSATRSLIRHDPDAIAQELMHILSERGRASDNIDK